MKKVKIKYVDFGPGFNGEYSYFTYLLRKFYEVEICDNPDYIIYSVYGEEDGGEQYQNYDCIRIFHTIENISFVPEQRVEYRPNAGVGFDKCDYGIAYDWIENGDRYLRYPYYNFCFLSLEKALKKHLISEEEMLNKTKFCNFVYSNHYRLASVREDFFRKLSYYKVVDSAGKRLNNIGYYLDNSPELGLIEKLKFQESYKFSVAFENDIAPGYTTEKIIDAFAAKTIPIYWGNPEVCKDFNTKAFINCHEYNSFEEVIERVKEIDNDDNLFRQMLNEPIVNNPNDYLRRTENRLIEFLRNIFDQSLEDAKRR